jgi:hypothetical protein
LIDCTCLCSDKKTQVLNIAIGVYFAFVYLAFRYLGNVWYIGAPLYIIGLLSTIVMPFVLAYLCIGSKNGAKIVAIVLCCILLLSPITRPVVYLIKYHPWSGAPQTVKMWESAIPLNLSNLCALSFLICFCTKNKILIGFMVCAGIAGGLVNNVQAHNTHMVTFWWYQTWESYFVHALMVIVPIFVLLTNQVQLRAKSALKNYYWFTPWFLITGFLLNPLWGTNYNFTYYQRVLEKVLPQISQPISFLNGHFDPIYMIFVFTFLSLTFIICYYIGVLMTKISKRWYLKVD